VLNSSNPYFRQVELMLALMPVVGREACFALKGGSAINLFVHDLPRLSVDLDLTFLPIKERAQSLVEIDAALVRIGKDVTRAFPDAKVKLADGAPGERTRLLVTRGGAGVKAEVSPVLRGAVGRPQVRGVCPAVEKQFGYVEMQLLHPDDLYAGKLCAALDRQHPRDLFDVKLLLDGEGVGDEMLEVFIVYLISGNRSLAEMIAPQFQPLETVFETQFKGMTLQPVTVAELEETRRALVKLIRSRLTDDQRNFLLSFKQGEPNWPLLSMTGVEQLPAVQWKLINIRRMPKARHTEAVEKLRRTLFEAIPALQ
jgi:hypothetical protein